MSLLNNVKVSAKIMILVLIAAIGMAAIGYKGYSTINQSKDGMAVIYNQSLQQVQEIGETKYLMRDMQSRAILAMVATTKERHDDLRNDANEIQKNFEIRELQPTDIKAIYDEPKKERKMYVPRVIGKPNSKKQGR